MKAVHAAGHGFAGKERSFRDQDLWQGEAPEAIQGTGGRKACEPGEEARYH